MNAGGSSATRPPPPSRPAATRPHAPARTRAGPFSAGTRLDGPDHLAQRHVLTATEDADLLHADPSGASTDVQDKGHYPAGGPVSLPWH